MTLYNPPTLIVTTPPVTVSMPVTVVIGADTKVVRHRQVRRPELHDVGREPSEPRNAGGFFRSARQQLHPEADPEKRHAGDLTGAIVGYATQKSGR